MNEGMLKARAATGFMLGLLCISFRFLLLITIEHCDVPSKKRFLLLSSMMLYVVSLTFDGFVLPT